MVKPLYKNLILLVTLALATGWGFAQDSEPAPAVNAVTVDKNEATGESAGKSTAGESVGKKIDRAATKTGHAIKKTATKTGRAIKKGVVKVEHASKKAANWTGEKIENAGKSIKNSTTD
ncbi:MAG: hypothetical protein V4568_17270 [Pseudomonadota bacterium]